MPPTNTSTEAAMALLHNDFSLADLPTEILKIVARCLDHKSLVRLGATGSHPLRQLVQKDDLNSHWEALHRQRWTSGKRHRFYGPPSQRPRDGVVPVEGDLNWREEFIRRFVTDKSVPDRLARVEGANEAFHSLVSEGADIYDKLKLLSMDEDYSHSAAAKQMLVHINSVEALADWMALYYQPVYDIARMDDGLMVLSKAYQSCDDILERRSTDAIYDEVNIKLDALAPYADSDNFGQHFTHVGEVEEMCSGSIDTILLDKVLEQRTIGWAAYEAIRGRVGNTRNVGEREGDLGSFWQSVRLFCLTTLPIDRINDSPVVLLAFIKAGFNEVSTTRVTGLDDPIQAVTVCLGQGQENRMITVSHDPIAFEFNASEKIYVLAKTALDKRGYWDEVCNKPGN